MDSPEDTVQLVIVESERLTQYLTALPPEAWRKPSACDRWEVRDVVAHLAGQAGELRRYGLPAVCRGTPRRRQGSRRRDPPRRPPSRRLLPSA